MHAGLIEEASYSPSHDGALVGTVKRTGDAAKGTPRNLFTTAVALGNEVVVPIFPSASHSGTSIAGTYR